MCLSGTAKQFSLYNICNFCVLSYTYICYVLVYFVLYVYNCMHKRTIKYLVSCILLDTVFRREIDSQRQWGYGTSGTCYGDNFPLRRSVGPHIISKLLNG